LLSSTVTSEPFVSEEYRQRTEIRSENSPEGVTLSGKDWPGRRIEEDNGKGEATKGVLGIKYSCWLELTKKELPWVHGRKISAVLGNASEGIISCYQTSLASAW